MKIENCKIDNSNKIPRILLVDMNSYFASVEQQANPHYRGKPLGVCASVHRTSCLIATSKEAKKLGIKTGTLVYKAQAVCPDIVLVQAEPEKYREVNRQINRIFGDYTHQVETYSVDESFLDFRQSQLNPVEVGAQIKRRIRDNTTPRHVPARVVQVPDIPRTQSGKIVELAVRNVVHGRPVRNLEALANPEALAHYRDRPELAS